MAARTTARPNTGIGVSAARGRAAVTTAPGAGVAARTKTKTKGKAKANARAVSPPLIADRVLALCLILSVSYIGIAARLFHLQITRHTELEAKARDLREKAIRLPARRGELLDRNGLLLVRNEPAYAIAIDPNPWFIKTSKNDKNTAAEYQKLVTTTLQNILPDVDVAGIITKRGVTKGKSGRYRTIEIAPIVPIAVGDRIKSENLLGVSVQPSARRKALDGELASHILGYTRRDGVGAAGVEYALDAALTGESGMVDAEFDPGGRPIPGTIRKEQPALNGKDVVLTLDSDLQHVVQESLFNAFKKAKAEAATAVVMDPHNGDILALANFPNYDVNQRKGVAKNAWLNRAVSAPFEPGSTLKAITVAAALEDHKVTTSSHFFCTGERLIGKRRIHCHNGEKHGDIDLTAVVKHSCNVATAECAFELGKNRLYDYLTLFGFGQKTESGLPGESSGILSPYGGWSDMQLSNIAFGQGISVTALQLVAAYGAIANDGVWVRPRIVRGARDEDGQIQDLEPEPGRRVLSANTAQSLRKMLQVVIDEGTGTAARLNGYTAGGKTGTAQIPERGRYGGKHLASFIGMAPLEKPRFVILVAITDPKGEYYGGAVSGPVFKEIAEKALVASRVQRDRILPAATTKKPMSRD